jgi:succinoglycan biosynthesis protein ExoO
VSTDTEYKGTVSDEIPPYKPEAFLARELRSVLNQTYDVLEVIIVDDGSTDGTGEVARTIASQDDRVGLTTLPVNGGPSKARNAGFMICKGDWIAVLDADDAFLPDRLEGMIEISNDADIVAGNVQSFELNTGLVGPPLCGRSHGSDAIDLLSFADTKTNLLDLQPMFRRAFLEQHNIRYPEDVRHGEDFLFMLEALARGALFRITWKPGYLYTARSSGWSRTVLDYQALSQSLLQLSNRSDLDLSPSVRAKLRERAAYADGLHMREEAKRALRERRMLRVVRLCLEHPVVRKSVLRKLKRMVIRS